MSKTWLVVARWKQLYMMFPYPVGGRYAPGVGQSARIGYVRVINHNFLTVNTNNPRFARHVAKIIGDTSWVFVHIYHLK